MSLVDAKLKQKVMDVVEQIITNLTGDEFKQFFHKYLGIFSDRTANKVNEPFLHSFVAAIETSLKSDDLEYRLAGIMLLYSLVNRIGNKKNEHSALADLIDEKLSPKLFDLFTFTKNELGHYDDAVAEDGSKQTKSDLRMRKMIILAVVELMSSLAETFRGYKKVGKNFDNFYRDMKEHEELEMIEKEYPSVSFDIVNGGSDLFARDAHIPEAGNALQQVSNVLTHLENKREDLYSFMINDPTEESSAEFDAKLRDYVGMADGLQQIMLDNKDLQLDNDTYLQIKRELQFAHFVMKDAQEIADQSDLAFSDLIALLIDQYDNIFYSAEARSHSVSPRQFADKEKSMDIPEVKTPIGEEKSVKTIGMRVSDPRSSDLQNRMSRFNTSNDRNNVSPNISNNGMKTSLHGEGPRISDSPAKPKAFANLFENQKILESRKDTSDMSLEKNQYAVKGYPTKNKELEEDAFKSFEQEPDQFKHAFANAGDFGFKAEPGMFRKNTGSGLKFKTEESMNRESQGFNFNDFGQFGDFQGNESGASHKNFSDFNNFNESAQKNTSAFGEQALYNNSSTAFQKPKSITGTATKTVVSQNNNSIVKVSTELKFGGEAQEPAKPSFKNFFNTDEPMQNKSQPLSSSSFADKIKERFRKNNVNVSGIDKRNTSSFIGAGSVNINFGGSRFISKHDNMTSSRISSISNPNMNIIKNGIAKHTPTLLTRNATTINSTAPTRSNVIRSSTTLKIEPVRRVTTAVAAPVVIPPQRPNLVIDTHNTASNNRTPEAPGSNNNAGRNENEPAFGFDDFQSIANNESQNDEASINSISNIIPNSFKYNASRTSRMDGNVLETNYNMTVPLDNQIDPAVNSKQLSSMSNTIRPSDNLMTPFDVQSRSMQAEPRTPFTPRANLDGIKSKHTDIKEKYTNELRVLQTQAPGANTQQSDNRVMNERMAEQKQQYEQMCTRMRTDYEALISHFKGGYLEYQHENANLTNSNEMLKNRIFQLENDLRTQADLKKIMETCNSDQLAMNSKNFELFKDQQKSNYEGLLRKTEADYKEKINRLNKDIERLTAEHNEKLNKYVIENNALKLEMASVRTDDQSRIYDVRKAIEDVRMQTSTMRAEMSAKIKSYAEQVKALSPKFTEVIASRNKLMNESLLTKSEITFYDKKTRELKEKLEKIESENFLLKSRTVKSSQVFNTSSLVMLKTHILNVRGEMSAINEQVETDLREYKFSLFNLKQLKAKKNMLENKLFNLEIQNNSRIGQINRLNFQFEGMREENEYLKNRVSDLLEQKKSLQNQILEITKEPTNFMQNTANDVDQSKKIRELEYEIKSLSEINKEITEENIGMKERLIRHDAVNGSEKLKKTLKQLENENDDLYHRNKSLLNELYEQKSSSQSLDKLKERVKTLERENNQLKAINTQLTFKATNKQNDNVVLYESTRAPESYANLRGTAFIKKYDMYLDLLNNKNTRVPSKTFLDLVQAQENKSEFAQKCIASSYCLFREGGFKILVEEIILHKSNTIELVLKLTFSNLVTTPNHVMNFKVICAGADEHKFASQPFNVELNSMEMAKKEVRVVLQESYLISGAPLVAHFCLLENYKMRRFLTGDENSIVDDNLHTILFPVGINKLLSYQKVEQNMFSVIKSLSTVGTLTLKNAHNIGKEDIYSIFPQLEIIGNNRYGVKIVSIYGNFMLTLDMGHGNDIKVDLFSMYENPIHEIYLATLRTVLTLI